MLSLYDDGGGVSIGTVLLPRRIATVAFTPVQQVAGASAPSGAYRRMPQVAGAMRRASYGFPPHPWFLRNVSTSSARVLPPQLLY